MNSVRVRNRKTGKEYDCMPLMVDVNNTGRYTLCYNIGIKGYNGWTFIHAIYDDDTFNDMYEVLS